MLGICSLEHKGIALLSRPARQIPGAIIKGKILLPGHLAYRIPTVFWFAVATYPPSSGRPGVHLQCICSWQTTQKQGHPPYCAQFDEIPPRKSLLIYSQHNALLNIIRVNLFALSEPGSTVQKQSETMIQAHNELLPTDFLIGKPGDMRPKCIQRSAF